MTFHSFRIAGVIALFLASVGPSHAQPPLAPRADRYGDPLPEGAIARLGTLRLTHLGGIRAVAISPDGSVAASGVSDGKESYPSEHVRVTEATIRFWNVKTGELRRQVLTPDAPVSHLRFAADGKTLFAGCGKFLCCWETDTGKKIWQREAILGEIFIPASISKKSPGRRHDRVVARRHNHLPRPVGRRQLLSLPPAACRSPLERQDRRSAPISQSAATDD